MTEDYIRQTILLRLGTIAFETAEAALDPSVDLCAQLALDDDDFWAYVQALGDELGVDVPERDYPELRTVEGGVRYFARTLA
ncbi:MAG: hypothetical protein KF729_13355 [Sandaracinaceae bacterium]|nr:hypothetical protein [Sandaracinaceae bacterium]